MGPNGRVDEHAIFIEALECDSDSARRALLESRCGGDEALRHRIDRLLELYAGSGDFLEEPVASRPAPPDNLYQPGTQIDGYELLEQIGEGGMGVVFAAKQETPIQRTVALKILKPGMDSRRLLARFDAERQVLALMDHPNIARVLDAGTTSLGHPYFVMEVVRGVPITEYCRARKLGIKARLRLFLTVCDAVQHAHQKGIIHRDLKPSNILVTDGDDRAFVKVIDFGIAKAIDCQLSIHSTLTGVSQVIGTPLYMSPEQAESGNLDIDTRSDIYSLGTVLYELLTDTTPFDTERLNTAIPNEMFRIIRSEEPPAPSARVELSASKSKKGECDEPAESPRWSHTLRGELDWIVMKSLDKDRARRYQTAKEFADDVRRYLDGEAVSACPPSILYRFRKTLRNHYRAVLTIAGAVLLLFVAATTTSVMAVRASRAERQATEAQVKAETEAAVAAAISDFLRNELLGQANPYENPDRELSLREVLDRASSRITGHFPGQPLVEAEIRMTLATAYLHLGELGQAESHFQHARRLRAQQLGSQHRETLKADYFLARVTFEKQGPATAADSFRRVLRAQEIALGRDAPDTLVTMDWLAWCYALQSRFSEAEALYKEASTGLRRKLGDTHPDTLDCLEGLAQLYAFEEKYAEAEELQQAVLEDRRR
ncbi:MAG TPA: serine/threonine protein kinase, partial [Planctomycetaceae bacterium]|nr:serine/threonine protein kinase [Planctomycetaceae bacterium]